MEDDLKIGRLDRGLAKDRDRWKAQIIGKISELCDHGKRDVKLEERVLFSPQLRVGVHPVLEHDLHHHVIPLEYRPHHNLPPHILRAVP